jgi:hypothetical protein
MHHTPLPPATATPRLRWLSEAEILYESGHSADEKTAFFTHLAWSLLVPYCTAKGLDEYRALTEMMTNRL